MDHSSFEDGAPGYVAPPEDTPGNAPGTAGNPPPDPPPFLEPPIGSTVELKPPEYGRPSPAATPSPVETPPPPPPEPGYLPPPPPSPFVARPQRQFARVQPEQIHAAPPEPPRRVGFWRLALLALVAAGVGATAAVAGILLLDRSDEPAPDESPSVTVIERVRTEIVGGEDGAAMVAPAVGRRVIPSIVTVEVDTVGGSAFIADGSGSGVVLDSAGHIITNEHVVAGAETVRVVFADGRVYEAEVIGTDARTDLAALKIDAVGLVPIEFGSSIDLSIGDPAIAVGSPLGLQGGPSLTVGVISAFDRQVQTGPNRQTDILFGMLQTDAPITRGSSGGALVDTEGRLIGITSAIGVSNVGAEGIGFAIPVELVERVINEIIETGEARHAFLGIGGETDFDESIDGALVPVGVLVVSMESGSAADRAGLLVGDRITSVDAKPVTTMDGLIITLRAFSVGTMVELAVDRGQESMMLPVELGERPPPS